MEGKRSYQLTRADESPTYTLNTISQLHLPYGTLGCKCIKFTSMVKCACKSF